MTPVLCALFFLSGAAALLFETLWFRQAGLAFGNSVWASSLVLSGFMAGLALGNAVAARLGGRIRRPVLAYGLLELAIAATGVALVYALPALGSLLAPVFRRLLDQPWLLNPLRLGVGFACLLVPATAMGATLPVLVKALSARDPSFGSVLGRLYGWNTLGAVVGAVAGEAFLVEAVGVRGAARVAGACNAAAAAGALLLARRLGAGGEAAWAPAGDAAPAARPSGRAARLLAAAFCAGGILLALEVVWFRFLHLFVHSGSLAFSMMLAVVLAGIALGGFAGGAWLRRRPGAARHTAALALASGCVTVALYALFERPLARVSNELLAGPAAVTGLAASLTLPVCLLSGVLFTFTGALLRDELAPETRAAGWLTLANTLGAASGSALAGFALLPLLGMERSLLLLAASYAAVAVFTWPWAAATGRAPRALAVAAFAASLALFPGGALEGVYLRRAIDRWDAGGRAEVVAVREGRTETAVYLRDTFEGQTLGYRLLTDGFAMSATTAFARRYMKLFVYWPVALHPAPRRALLISYGVGSTAKALVDTRALEHIDVVDISRDILELSRVVHPESTDDPLGDPRVRVHIEDGRFFLQVTDERYDLITAEPPPPKNAGVVNLYTREYFQLIRDRLNEGGMVTYWLPVHNTLPSDTRAIIRAFCDVFPDCSLWSGAGLDWMLAGSRDARFSRDEAAFARQWRDPALAFELRAVGLELPEQLGALFMADADQLASRLGDAEPLVDDWPKRISNLRHVPAAAWRTYDAWMDTSANRHRFRESSFVARAWPPALRERSLPYFEVQELIERDIRGLAVPMPQRMRELWFLLRDTPLTTAPLWHLGISSDKARAAERARAAGALTPLLREVDARVAVARRRYAQALAEMPEATPGDPASLYFRATVLALAGRGPEALALEADNRDWLPDDAGDRRFWRWLARVAAHRPPAASASPAPPARYAASDSASATISSRSARPLSQKAGSFTSTSTRASRDAGVSDPPARSSSR